MKKAILLSLLVLVLAGIGLTTVYAGYVWRQQFKWAWNNGGLQNQPIQIGKQKIKGFIIEVSDEFKEKALNIALSDGDVQNLILQGYNVTSIRPVIKMIVKGDGTVVLKATGAVILLTKGKGEFAQVVIDMEKGIVTQIVIRSITVIQKTG
ncbi:MAG: hypothetical protein N3E39_00175 [Candidatus Methanomethylicia archaeon]|nr:hypothetical protein [Candidatus Methanomethylicia archaeon]